MTTINLTVEHCYQARFIAQLDNITATTAEELRGPFIEQDLGKLTLNMIRAPGRTESFDGSCRAWANREPGLTCLCIYLGSR